MGSSAYVGLKPIGDITFEADDSFPRTESRTKGLQYPMGTCIKAVVEDYWEEITVRHNQLRLKE